MDVIWLTVLGFLLAGWFVLDGYTLGVGMLLRRLGPEAGERRLLLAGVGPYFLAGEVWLVVFAGVLLAAFPELEKELFTSLRPVVVVLVVCWVLRSSALWLRLRRDGAGWQRGWERTLAGASAGLAACWGLLLGNVAQGLPGRGAFAALTPLPLACALTLPVLLAVHGATVGAARTTGALSLRAGALAGRLALPAAGLLGCTVLTGALTAVLREDAVSAPLPALVCALAAVAALAWARTPLAGTAHTAALPATALAAAAPALTVGIAAHDSLTALAAPRDALDSLAPALLPALALVVAVQAGVLWLFRGRADGRSTVFF
ncbi:cytochrome d ubiquinol oxidase subunit II [Streptomyces polyrhachis]|uniref:Cytochrome d ubiquinol oxidase subunit II n=1 Tax=Streptomyces polyrhachis TaxID=1282885 RepID=A0ABW2G955_9ACTN